MRASLRRSLGVPAACTLVLSGLAIAGATLFVAPSVTGESFFHASPVTSPGADILAAQGTTTLKVGTPSSGQIPEVSGTSSQDAPPVTSGGTAGNGHLEPSSSNPGNNSAVALPDGNTSAVNATTLSVTGNLTFSSTGTGAPSVKTSGGSASSTNGTTLSVTGNLTLSSSVTAAPSVNTSGGSASGTAAPSVNTSVEADSVTVSGTVMLSGSLSLSGPSLRVTSPPSSTVPSPVRSPRHTHGS